MRRKLLKSLFSPKAFPARGRYLVRYFGVSIVLRCIDIYLSLFKRPFSCKVTAPKRILLSNLAHLGDVVNATAVLPVIKSAFPGIKIGFIVGSWSKELLDAHPLVDDIYVVDHWKFNRTSDSFFRKICHYLKTRRIAASHISKMKYDVAIDLYYYFGNAIPLIHKCKIPIRIGYTSGGFGPLLTHPLQWQNVNQRIVDYYIDLVRVLPVQEEHLLKLDPILAPVDSEVLHQLVARFPQMKQNYLVIHPGSGASFKDWPIEKWKGLLQECRNAGYLVFITGHGSCEKKVATELLESFPEVVDCVGKLSLKEFIAIIQKATVLVGVDSAAGHIASAVKTRSVLIYPGINNSKEWVMSKLSKIVQHPVSCSPCYQRKGCKSMDCVRRVQVEDLFSEVNSAIASQEPSKCR